LEFYDYICQNNCGHILGWGMLAGCVWRFMVLMDKELGLWMRPSNAFCRIGARRPETIETN
jgi:hypothetical protein